MATPNSLLVLSWISLLKGGVTMNADELNDKSIVYTLSCSTTGRSVEIPFKNKAKAAFFMGWKDHGKSLLCYACMNKCIDVIMLACSFYTSDDIYECIDVSLSSSNLVLTLLAALTFNYFISRKLQQLFKPLQTEITHIKFEDITLSSLHVAAAMNDVDSVSYFVRSNEAHEFCGIKRYFEEDESPLYYAVIYDADDVVNYLAKEVDADVLHRCIRSVLTTGTSISKSSKCLYLLQQRYLNIIFQRDKPDNVDEEKFVPIINNSSYPIHHSIHLKYFPIAQYLLKSHIFNINSLNEDSLTPLQIAIESKSLEIIRTITEYSDCNLLCKNVKGLTPLHLACESGCLDIVQHFINDKEIDVNVRSSSFDSPLHIACKNCHLSIVKFLTNNSKCNIEAVNRKGDTPIHVAVQPVNVDVIKHLMSSNCNLNAKGEKGLTPLHYACMVGGQRGGFELVKILTSDPQCDINAFDNCNEGPIHKASRVGNFDIVSHLMNVKGKKCKFKAKGDWGTPLDISLNKRNLDIVYFLLSKYSSHERKALVANNEKIKFILDIQKLHASNGITPLRIVKCILTGPPGAGKTTLKRRFHDEPIPENYSSTGIVDASKPLSSFRRLSQQSAHTLAESEVAQWTKQEKDDKVYYQFQSLLMQQKQPCSWFNEERRKPRIASKSEIKNSYSAAGPDLSLKNPTDEHSQDKKSSKPTNALKSNKGVAMLANNLISLSSSKRKQCEDKFRKVHQTCSDDYTELCIFDTGGQPEFHEILPALIFGPVIVIVVFKLTLSLRQRYTIEYVSPDGTKSSPYVTSLTHEEVIFRSLGSIASLRNSTSEWGLEKLSIADQSTSSAFLVATHKDLVNDDQVAKINDELKKKIKSSSHLLNSNIVQFSGSEADSCIFPLDTREGDISKLRTAISDVMKRQFFQCPLQISWYMFSIKLQESKKKHFLYDACFKLADSCGIADEDEFKKVLWFLHYRVGIIMYYPTVNGLENVIFTDLQFVFNRITKLIINCFTNNEEVRNVSVVHNFQNNGTFTKSALDELCARDKGDPLTFDRLVALLEHLYVVAPMENQEYFMPCALKPVEISSAIDNQNYDKISSLLITFDCGYVPVGVFCCLIVYILSSSIWTLAKKEGHYRNKMTFIIGKYYDVVILLCHPTYLEVQVQPQYKLRDECDVTELIEDIFENVNTGLQKIMESLRYPYEIKLGILCNSCSFSAPHPAIISKSVKIAYCEYTDEAMKLDCCHLLWYDKVRFIFYNIFL